MGVISWFKREILDIDIKKEKEQLEKIREKQQKIREQEYINYLNDDNEVFKELYAIAEEEIKKYRTGYINDEFYNIDLMPPWKLEEQVQVSLFFMMRIMSKYINKKGEK